MAHARNVLDTVGMPVPRLHRDGGVSVDPMDALRSQVTGQQVAAVLGQHQTYDQPQSRRRDRNNSSSSSRVTSTVYIDYPIMNVSGGSSSSAYTMPIVGGGGAYTDMGFLRR